MRPASPNVHVHMGVRVCVRACGSRAHRTHEKMSCVNNILGIVLTCCCWQSSPHNPPIKNEAIRDAVLGVYCVYNAVEHGERVTSWGCAVTSWGCAARAVAGRGTPVLRGSGGGRGLCARVRGLCARVRGLGVRGLGGDPHAAAAGTRREPFIFTPLGGQFDFARSPARAEGPMGVRRTCR